MAGTFLRAVDTPRVEVKLFGRWEETIKMVQNLSPAIKIASIAAQMKVCNEILKRVRRHLRNQDLGWRPLSSRYSALKAESGLDGRTLIAHGTYYHAIQVWSKGIGHMVFVGVKKGTYGSTASGKKSKIDVARIATIHEFSSGRRIPRRPLWNPTIREIGGVGGIKKMYLNSLMYRLRLLGIPVKPFRRLL